MKTGATPFFVENLNEIIDPDFFTMKDQEMIIKYAWASFLKRKKERAMPQPSQEELRRRYYSLSDEPIGSQRKRSKKEEEYWTKYTGAFIKLSKEYDRLDALVDQQAS